MTRSRFLLRCPDLFYGLTAVALSCGGSARAQIARTASGWEQIYPWPSGSSYERSLVANERIVVVAEDRIISAGPDLNWTVSQIIWRPQHLLRAFERFFAFRHDNTYYVSRDGITWTEETFDHEPSPAQFAHGNGVLLAASNTSRIYRRSIDGESWTTHTAPHPLDHLIFGNNVFLAKNGVDRISGSVDGVDWAELVRFDTPTWPPQYLDGRFYARQNSVLLSSADGRQWRQEPPVNLQFWEDVAVAGDFLFSFRGDPGTMHVSADGAEWTTVKLPSPARNVHSVAFFAGAYFLFGSHGLILTSKDALEWQSYDRQLEFELASVVFHEGQFLAIAASSFSPSAGRRFLLQSADLQNWRIIRARTDATYAGLGPVNGRLFLTGRTEPEDAGFVSEFTSQSEETRLVRPRSWFERPAWDGSHFWCTSRSWERVQTGDGTWTNEWRGTLFKSEDGVEWAEATIPSEFRPLTVAGGNGRVVVLGDSGLISSEDGQVWHIRERPGIYYSTVAYGAGPFVVIGGNRKHGEIDWNEERLVEHSVDGQVWFPGGELKPLAGAGKSHLSLSYAGDRFIASEPGYCYISKEGLSWESINFQFPGLSFGYGEYIPPTFSFAFGNGIMAAVADNYVLRSARAQGLRLSIAPLDSSGTLELLVSPRPVSSAVIHVQRSADLRTWVNWFVNTNWTTGIEIDPSSQAPGEYFRAVQVP